MVRKARCSAATRRAAPSASGRKRPAEEFGGNVTVTAGSLDRADVKASLDVPLGEKIRTKWTGANLSRDGYINSQTTATNGGGIDQQVLRGDIAWDVTDNLDFRFNYQSDESTFTEPRVMDAMFRTFDDPNERWVKSIIGTPELYTYVGTDFRGLPVEPMYVPELPSRRLIRTAVSACGRTARARRCRTSTTPSSSRSRRTGSSPTT